MTYMTEPRADQSVSMPSAAEAPSSLSMGTYRLLRMGTRPIVFQGEELGMAMSFTPDWPYWFEINLFRATDGTFPVAIKQYFVSEYQKNLATAEATHSLSAAFDFIEHFDPAQYIPLTTRVSAAPATAAEMGAAAMDLKAQVEAMRSHYRGLVGEFMHEIDAA
ncbi:MAG: hypothetical protein AAFR47_08520 [Pseudomonadota bacterium]